MSKKPLSVGIHLQSVQTKGLGSRILRRRVRRRFDSCAQLGHLADQFAETTPVIGWQLTQGIQRFCLVGLQMSRPGLC